MDKATVQKMIVDLGAKDLLKCEKGPDDNNFLVVCQMDGNKHKVGAPEALQKIADADSARVREAEKAAEAKAKAEATAEAKPPQ